VVFGDLLDVNALSHLMAGTDAVINAAGLIKARSRADFFAINQGGARQVAIAASGRRLIHVSSLAAREPSLSDYAASKLAGEAAIAAIAQATATVVRPPAMYGPGDRETLTLFKAARGPIVLTPGTSGARVAIAEVDDVASVIIDLLGANSPIGSVTIGGDRPAGYGWNELVTEAARAVHGHPAIAAAPPWLVKVAGAASEMAGRWRREPPIFTLGKARESLHGDWSVSIAEQGVTAGKTYTVLSDGFARTVEWYRARGWL
jgi:nucleoside-diphosphate-sugar epimerase